MTFFCSKISRDKKSSKEGSQQLFERTSTERGWIETGKRGRDF